mmetsp:Transcript_17853/g.23510  ORF Transcript_17853/g.23510 Transcript_17853/m.23510 type:complete len:413 (-) Transcript_17853:103-1341(-)|eukprot:CAMPEP_0117750540 /NCGR_PEP_ID=MMETSP0947-20121206/10433_1 /TAXON_ID=44440 /ORGANISM="Chattonella subsalsa, Strain CCMP2191" /LENGTH=412 /DNA_ID=CAMNT_0005568735 /DNA_START=193 /DNA_END=1431 /DNA_ORIENTATION=+
MASSPALGVLLPFIGGVLNSSWNIPTREVAPKAFKIKAWDWENTWLVKSFFSIIINATYVCAVIGTPRLSSIYDVATSAEISLVCIFSIFWSIGILCFGIGQKLAGVAVGISLSMSLLVVIGTLLPLVIDNRDEIGSLQSIVTCVGVLLAVLGFCTCAKASIMKDAALKAQKHFISEMVVPTNSIGATEVAPNGMPKSIRSHTDLLDYEEGKELNYEKDKDPQHEEDGNKVIDDAQESRRFYLGVFICIICAVFSACLQAAFVFGKPIVDEAINQGVASSNSSLVIWLFAYTFGSGGCLAYAVYKLCKEKTWHRFGMVSFKENIKNALKAFLMAIFFVTHIHLYGAGQSFLGDLGPAIAWPLIMSSTVLFGQLWGIYLKEWDGAPRPAVQMNVLSFSLLISAVTVIAIASFI